MNLPTTRWQWLAPWDPTNGWTDYFGADPVQIAVEFKKKQIEFSVDRDNVFHFYNLFPKFPEAARRDLTVRFKDPFEGAVAAAKVRAL